MDLDQQEINKIMNKPLLVYQAPVSTLSGYGSRSRDLLRALRELDKFDIKIVSTRWGNTPMDQLDPSDEFHNWILTNIVTSVNTPVDVFMQVTVPNEFQRNGRFNIGVTAGIETNICSKEFIEGVNRMDLVLTSSVHAKNSLGLTVYQEKNKTTGEVISETRVNKPIEVLFEGIDYNPIKEKTIIDDIKEDFCFLFVGHWLQGESTHDRKDIAGMIQTFLATFSAEKGVKPALILKSSSAGLSVRDRELIAKKIEDVKNKVKGLAPVYLLHGDLTEDEMWSVYNNDKVKAMISFTHGEGFGRPLLEFTMTGKPTIAPGWSGQLDFLDEPDFHLPGKLENVHHSAANQFILKESQWFYVNYTKASYKLVEVFTNYDYMLNKSKFLANKNRDEFSHLSMRKRLNEIFDNNVKIVSQVQLKLPVLTPISK